jgi:tight adherence protein C
VIETYFFIIVFGLAVAGATLALLVGLGRQSQARAFEEERLYSVTRTPTLEQVDLSRPFRERVIQPSILAMLRFLSRFAPQRNIEQMRLKLEVAGRPYGWTAADFLGVRLLSGVVLGIAFFAFLLLFSIKLPVTLLLTAASVILGFYLPIVWLGLRISQRKQAILRALPDGLDMLNICVGAGLGFDAALSKLGERWHNPLADEFNRVVKEIQFGKTRRQALLDMSARTQVTEMDNFVATIVQADQLGVSIARVLRAQAEQMRIIRRQRAEEMARKAAIKLLFPLVFMIFPALLAVLLGPGVPQIVKTLGNLGR